MPGKVTLSGEARSAFLRDGRDEPRMVGKIDARHIPRGIGVRTASQKRGEYRRSVKPSASAGRHVRHCEVEVRFRNSSGLRGKGGGKGGWHADIKRYVGSYLTREGAGLNGERAEALTVEDNGKIVKADGMAFVEQTKNDRSVIEIILPPNDGHKIADMAGFSARFMDTVQRDLNTELTWVMFIHEKHDKAHPVDGPKNKHTHILMRDADDEGRPLWISREYLASTLRDVAQKELSAFPTNEKEKGWRLGPMTSEESDAFQTQMAANRPSRIERRWTKPNEQELRQMQRDKTLTAAMERDETTERKRDRTRGAGMGEE